MNWTQPCCEACWIEKRGVWVADLATGKERLATIATPVRIVPDHAVVERCCYCGKLTIVGIYIREDPTKVPYPSPDTTSDEPVTIEIERNQP